MTVPDGSPAPGPHDRSGRLVREPVALSDLQLVATAGVVWCAALIAYPFSIPAAVASVGLSLLARRRAPFIVAVGLLASGLAHRAVDDFRPVDTASFDGSVVVIAEARPFGIGWRAIVRLPDGRRVDASGFGRSGAQLRRAGGGSRLNLEGLLTPVPDSSWARARHLSGRLAVSAVGELRRPEGPRALVEDIRSTIVAGAEPLPPNKQPLYLGLVIGEDRLQSPAQRARFRAAGLSHLLAVSGQNVAFVLALARPGLTLLGLRGRLIATVSLLTVFAVATRFEPSVLRATVTAGLATALALSGHERDGVRILSLTVIGLVLLDPFLVHAVGFQLSIAASAGILVLAPVIAGRLRGPAVLRETTSVTLSAQLAVLPLQLHYFGPVSAAAIPANVLAGWAAGLTMALGLSVGPVAGVVPAPLDRWLQQPTSLLLWWLDGVARLATAVRFPLISASVMIVVGALIVLRWIAAGGGGRPGEPRSFRSKVAAAAVGGLIVLVLFGAVPARPHGVLELEGGGQWFSAQGSAPAVLIVSADADPRLLDSLTRAGLNRVDLIVAQAGSGSGAIVAGAVAELLDHGRLLAPPDHRIVGAHRLTEVIVVETTTGGIVVEPEGGRLLVSHGPSGAVP